MSTKPNITVYFLQASRAIRVPWLLEELDLPYDVVFSTRSPAGVGPPEFKNKIPASLKKSPTIKDGELVVQESGAIVEYLCATYDKSFKLLPKGIADRSKVYEWVHAAEGTFMLHGLAILYARWKIPEAAKQYLPEMEQAMSANVHNDLRWIESTLKDQRNKDKDFLVGDGMSVADIMMQFSVEFIFTRKLGLGMDDAEKMYPETTAWLKRTMARQTYKNAVDKTGYTLDSKGQFKT